MTVEPTPVVVFDGADIASGPAGASVVALDDFDVTWGRTDPLDHPEPGTGTVRLWDPTGRWATSRSVVGRRLDLRWEVPGNGRYFFRGRVDTVRAYPHTAGGVRGAQVELSVTSVLADLGNIVPTTAWFSEPLDQAGGAGEPGRRSRIAVWAAPVLPGGITVRPGYAAVRCEGYLNADQVSVWEHLTTLFDSTGGARIGYDPHTQSVAPLFPRDLTGRRALAQLVAGPRGAAVLPRQFVTGAGQVALDAAALEYDPADGVTKAAATAITRLSLDQWNGVDGTGSERVVSETALATTAEETAIGIRTMKVQTVTTFTTNGTDWQAFLRSAEVTGWRLEPLRLRTAATPLPTVDACHQLIRGGETMGTAFLSGSVLPRLNVAPVVAIIGGRIGHTDGGWDLEWNVAALRSPVPQHPIFWNELDPAGTLLWSDDPDSAQGFDPAVRWDDLAYVGPGLGADSSGAYAPASSSWDFTTA